jgi:hypothetical protein
MRSSEQPATEPQIRILTTPITREQLQAIADERFGDMVKAVVDVAEHRIAVGGELHADEEAVLLESGSMQANLWGINLYPALPPDSWLEFDSMINIRPRQGNRSRGVEDEALQRRIRAIVDVLVVTSRRV